MALASRAGHFWWVCRWPAVSWNTGQKEKPVVKWPQILYMFLYLCLSWLHGSCVALRAHWHLLPQGCIAKRMRCLKLAHSPVLERHNANPSPKFELFRNGNPAPPAVKENRALRCSGYWAFALPSWLPPVRAEKVPSSSQSSLIQVNVMLIRINASMKLSFLIIRPLYPTLWSFLQFVYSAQDKAMWKQRGLYLSAEEITSNFYSEVLLCWALVH